MLERFLYVQVPDFTGDVADDVYRVLIGNNRQKTFEHVKAVAEMNVKIAEMYNLDKAVCEASGYLHDISAVIAPSDMLVYAQEKGMYIDEAEMRYPFILHQRMSRLVAEQDFRVGDERILSAVECHSTLKVEPSDYDMALFVADKLAWDQEGKPPFYDVVYDALQKSLEEAALVYMKYIVDNKTILYPHRWFLEGMDYLAGSGKSCRNRNSVGLEIKS